MEFTKIIPLFVEGVMTFFSPCVLPIIPLFFAYLSNWASHESEMGQKKVSYFKFLLLTFCFIAGVSVIFFIVAFSSSAISQWITEYQLVFEYGASFVIILFALYYLHVIDVPFLNQQHKLPFNLNLEEGSYGTAFLLGFLFSFGWTPCVGPMLGFAISVSATGENGFASFVYVMAYALGFILMFLLLGLASKFVLNLIEKAKKVLHIITLVAGLVMLGMGGYIFYEASVKTVALSNNTASIGSGNDTSSTEVSEDDVITMEDLNFTLKNKDGDDVSLTDYQGKKTIVMFFGTWCTYCRQELPSLQEYLENHDDVNILLVSHPDSGIHDESVETVDTFMEENGYTMDYVYDTGGSVSMYFTGGSFPANFFFNSDGTLLGTMPGAMSLEQIESVIDTQMY